MGAALRRLLVLAALLLLVPGGFSFPNGVNETGDEGCLCHGASTASLAVSIDGLPEVYTPNATYTLLVTGDASHVGEGGFRLTVDAGRLEIVNATGTHLLDEGATHTAPSSTSVGWEVRWIAPEVEGVAATVVVHVNHVDGGGSSEGDRWSSHRQLVPGPAYDGNLDVDASDGGTTASLVVGSVALGAMLILPWVASRYPVKR